MIGFTWSMVADFYKKIREEIDFRDRVNDDMQISRQDVESIFTNLHISREDFEHQRKQTSDWLDRVRNSQKKTTVGF